MISDNFVTGDNVYLNELKNFFFEALGMMSITHYGAIGDGRTDNYASLQVAIEDAHRRGLKYIYVPGGKYRYRGDLLHLEGITFIGNSHAKIFNDRTGEQIPVIQFALGENSLFNQEYTYMINMGYYIDIPDGTGIKVDITPIPGENVAYFLAPIKGGELYKIYGSGRAALLNKELEITEGWGFTASSDAFVIGPSTADFDGYIVVSFDHTNVYEPHIWHSYDWAILGLYEVPSLSEDIVLVDGTIPTLESGFYYTGPYSVGKQDNAVIGPYEVFYYDKGDATFCSHMYNFYHTADTQQWEIINNEYITDTVENNRHKVPTSKAVYEALSRTSTNAITAFMTTYYIQVKPYSGDYEFLPFGDARVVGTGLTLQNDGSILIGTGITAVRVSASIRVMGQIYANHNTAVVYIDRVRSGTNNVICVSSLNYENVTATALEASLDIGACVMDVQAGDLITVRVYNDTSQYGWQIDGDSRFPVSWLTVEAIQYGE